MRNLLAFGFLGILIGGMSVSAQTNTVTNSDLERFRERRLQTEREYRENYKRLGMPSPEEIDERRDEDISRIVELGDRLRRERSERESRAAELAILSSNSGLRDVAVQPIVIRDGGGYFISSGNYYRGWAGWRGRYGIRQPISWRAAGGAIYWEPGGRSSFIWSSPYRPKLSRLQGPRQR